MELHLRFRLSTSIFDLKLQYRGHPDTGVGIEQERDVAAMRSSVSGPRTSRDLRAGDIKHGFRILSRLGNDPDRGVFLAAHAKRGDLVVLKNACRASEPDSFERILREHDVLSGLSDPTIRPAVRIHRVREGLRTTEVTLVARFVDASDLSESNEIDAAAVLTAAAGACEGLAHAHEGEIVHGRMDAGHILREPGGGIRIIGFGSAVKAGTRFDAEEAGGGFLAPECHLGGVATGRTDIFGLAATVWSLLGGSDLESGFEEELDGEGWLVRHRSWRRRIEESSMSPRLAALLVRCLHPDPLRRPASIKAVGDALQRLVPEVACDSSMRIGQSRGSGTGSARAA